MLPDIQKERIVVKGCSDALQGAWVGEDIQNAVTGGVAVFGSEEFPSNQFSVCVELFDNAARLGLEMNLGGEESAFPIAHIEEEVGVRDHGLVPERHLGLADEVRVLPALGSFHKFPVPLATKQGSGQIDRLALQLQSWAGPSGKVMGNTGDRVGKGSVGVDQQQRG